MANTIHYGSTNGVDADGRTSESVNTSICPTGWKLPRGGEKDKIEVGADDYYTLALAVVGEVPENYNDVTTPHWRDVEDGTEGTDASKAMRAYPNNFVYSGYYGNSSASGGGNIGFYWTSTVHGNNKAYRLSLRSTSVGAGVSADHKYFGQSIRCMTPSVQNSDVTVNFDSGISSVTFYNASLGSVTATTGGESVPLAKGVSYTLSAIYSSDERGFDNWATTANGVLGDATIENTTYTISGDTSLTLTSKAVCPSGKVCYKRNDTDTGTLSGVMGRQSIGASSTVTTLWSSNYSNSEYGFAGWNTAPDGSGTSYGPNETITYETGTYSSPNKGLLLYAMWVESEGNLQGWNECHTLNVGDVTALTDQRDNQVYAVAKLADGNCWMIENLRLEYGATRGATNQALAQGYGGVFTGLAAPETDGFDNVTTPNSLYTTDTTSTTLNVITGDSLAWRIPRYRNDYTSNRVSEMTGGGDEVYSYGNYYNFAAAVANTDAFRDANQSINTTSLCPAGWRLPEGGDKDNEANNEFWSLIVNELNDGVLPINYADGAIPYYTGDEIEISRKARKYPNNFVYSGAAWGGSEMGNRGSTGFYWTSTVGSSSYSYTFMFNQNGTLYPGTYGINKYNGRSVRCVANLSYSVTYDQNTNDTVTNMPSDNPQTGNVKVTTATVTLSADVPSRSKYVFKGWCDEATNDGTCSGNVYNPDGNDTNLSLPLDFTSDNSYTLYAMWEGLCEANTICYNENADSGVEGTMGKQSANANTSKTLYASNYSRSGYGFAGWNTEPDYSGTFYGPQETITTPADMSSGLILYAIWVASAGSMQTDATSVCNSLTPAPTNGTANLASVSALTDLRDGDTYAIARLADGKCWMIENLRLDNDNSDNATGTLAQGYGTSTTYGNFSGLADPEDSWTSDSTTANSLYSIDGSDGTIKIGDDSNPSRRFPRYNNQNTASRDSYTTTNQNIYSYGNYYTWAAAIADLNPNDTNNQTTAGTSLCPTGWHLPTGGAAYASDSTTGVNITGDTSTYRDFYYLSYKIMDEVKTAYEDTADNEGAYYSSDTTNLAGDTANKAFRRFPNNFILSGYVYNGSISRRNSYGLYWSSTARNTDYAYRLYINSGSSVYPSTAGGNKFYGRSVRCIAR